MTKFELTIDKKVINFNVGIGFLGTYQKKHNIGIDEIIQNVEINPWHYIPSLMYESALYADEKIKFSERDLIDMIDNDGSFANSAYLEFTKRFINCLSQDVPKETKIEDSKKK